MPLADTVQSNKQGPRHMEDGAVGVDEEDLREVNHFLIILVDNLVKPLVFSEVVKVGIFPDLVELLKARPQGSLQGIQTCVYLHTMHSKSDGLSGTGGAASRLSSTFSILIIIIKDKYYCRCAS